MLLPFACPLLLFNNFCGLTADGVNKDDEDVDDVNECFLAGLLLTIAADVLRNEDDNELFNKVDELVNVSAFIDKGLLFLLLSAFPLLLASAGLGIV